MLLRRTVVLRARARGLVAATGRDWFLLALAGVYLVGVAAAFLGTMDLAAPCVVGVNVGLVLFDWPGFFTLSHRVSWRQMDAVGRVGVGLVLATLWIAPVLYLDPALCRAWGRWQAELAARAGEMARLERAMGLPVARREKRPAPYQAHLVHVRHSVVRPVPGAERGQPQAAGHGLQCEPPPLPRVCGWCKHWRQDSQHCAAFPTGGRYAIPDALFRWAEGNAITAETGYHHLAALPHDQGVRFELAEDVAVAPPWLTHAQKAAARARAAGV
jgi:hypothetical protein